MTNEPKLIERTVILAVWDCGNPKHAHRSKDVASACMVARAAKPRRPSRAATRAQWFSIARSFLETDVHVAGDFYQVTPARVRQILHHLFRETRNAWGQNHRAPLPLDPYDLPAWRSASGLALEALAEYESALAREESRK